MSPSNTVGIGRLLSILESVLWTWKYCLLRAGSGPDFIGGFEVTEVVLQPGRMSEHTATKKLILKLSIKYSVFCSLLSPCTLSSQTPYLLLSSSLFSSHPPISGLWPWSPTYLSSGRAISFSLFPTFWKLIFLGANGAGKCFVKRMYSLPHREKCKETEILAIGWARVCGLVPVVPLGHTRCVWGLVIERYFRITFPKLFWKAYGHYSKEHA